MAHEEIGVSDDDIREYQTIVELCAEGKGPWHLDTFAENGAGVYIDGFWDAFEESYLPAVHIIQLRRVITLPETFGDKETATAAALDFVRELCGES